MLDPNKQDSINFLLDSNQNLKPVDFSAYATSHRAPNDSIITPAEFTATEASAWVTVILTFLTGVVGIWYKYIRKSNPSEKEKAPEVDASSAELIESPQKTIDRLVNHSFFSDIKKYERLVRYNFQVEQKVKLEVYKDFLIKKLTIWESLLYELAENIDSRCESCNDGCFDCNGGFSIAELKKMHVDVLAKGIDLYNNYYNSEDYTPGERDLCKYAAACFNEFHKDKVELVESVIDMLDKSFRFTKCPKVLTDMIFNTYTVAFILAFKDMAAVIDASNGHFDGKEFRKRNYGVSQQSFLM